VGKSGLYSFLTQPIETNPPTPSNTFAQSKIALAKSIKTKFKNMQHLYTILHHNLMIIIYMYVCEYITIVFVKAPHHLIHLLCVLSPLSPQTGTKFPFIMKLCFSSSKSMNGAWNNATSEGMIEKENEVDTKVDIYN